MRDSQNSYCELLERKLHFNSVEWEEQLMSNNVGSGRSFAASEGQGEGREEQEVDCR